MTYTGPKLQPKIQVVWLRARLWKHLLIIANIWQMCRQILVDPVDHDYDSDVFLHTFDIQEYRLHIRWRTGHQQSLIKHYSWVGDRR